MRKVSVLITGFVCIAVSAYALEVDPEHAKIVGSFQGNSDMHVTIIEDAHCHEEVQHNIVALLKSWREDAHARLLVGVEGAPLGEIDTSRLGLFHDETIDMKIVTEMFKAGKISAAEYLHATEGGFIFYGVEDQDHYIENLKAYKEFLSKYDTQRRDFEKIKKVMSAIKKVVLPEEYFDFEKKAQQYKAAFSIEYADFLHTMARRYEVIMVKNIEFYRLLENIKELQNLNITLLKKELQLYTNKTGKIFDIEAPVSALDDHAREELSQYPELKKNALLRGKLRAVHAEEISRDLRHLQKQIEYAIASEEHEQEFLRMNERVEKLDTLFNLRCTPDEYGELLKVLSVKDIDSIVAYIKSFQPSFTLEASYKPVFERRLSFYNVAAKRDRIIAENMIKIVRSLQSSINEAEPILIIGGFHAPGVAAVFEENQVSYDIIRPLITNISEKAQEKYFKVLKETTTEGLFNKN